MKQFKLLAILLALLLCTAASANSYDDERERFSNAMDNIKIVIGIQPDNAEGGGDATDFTELNALKETHMEMVNAFEQQDADTAREKFELVKAGIREFDERYNLDSGEESINRIAGGLFFNKEMRNLERLQEKSDVGERIVVPFSKLVGEETGEENGAIPIASETGSEEDSKDSTALLIIGVIIAIAAIAVLAFMLKKKAFYSILVLFCLGFAITLISPDADAITETTCGNSMYGIEAEFTSAQMCWTNWQELGHTMTPTEEHCNGPVTDYTDPKNLTTVHSENWILISELGDPAVRTEIPPGANVKEVVTIKNCAGPDGTIINQAIFAMNGNASNGTGCNNKSGIDLVPGESKTYLLNCGNIDEHYRPNYTWWRGLVFGPYWYKYIIVASLPLMVEEQSQAWSLVKGPIIDSGPGLGFVNDNTYCYKAKYESPADATATVHIKRRVFPEYFSSIGCTGVGSIAYALQQNPHPLACLEIADEEIELTPNSTVESAVRCITLPVPSKNWSVYEGHYTYYDDDDDGIYETRFENWWSWVPWKTGVIVDGPAPKINYFTPKHFYEALTVTKPVELEIELHTSNHYSSAGWEFGSGGKQLWFYPYFVDKHWNRVESSLDRIQANMPGETIPTDTLDYSSFLNYSIPFEEAIGGGIKYIIGALKYGDDMGSQWWTDWYENEMPQRYGNKALDHSNQYFKAFDVRSARVELPKLIEIDTLHGGSDYLELLAGESEDIPLILTNPFDSEKDFELSGSSPNVLLTPATVHMDKATSTEAAELANAAIATITAPAIAGNYSYQINATVVDAAGTPVTGTVTITVTVVSPKVEMGINCYKCRVNSGEDAEFSIVFDNSGSAPDALTNLEINYAPSGAAEKSYDYFSRLTDSQKEIPEAGIEYTEILIPASDIGNGGILKVTATLESGEELTDFASITALPPAIAVPETNLLAVLAVALSVLFIMSRKPGSEE